jgi:hypothetical protein
MLVLIVVSPFLSGYWPLGSIRSEKCRDRDPGVVLLLLSFDRPLGAATRSDPGKICVAR